MDKDFNISSTPNARMLCQDKECHCYGKVCLVSDLGSKGNCSAGNVFVNGKPFCGFQMTMEFGRAICKELGFKNVVKVTGNE